MSKEVFGDVTVEYSIGQSGADRGTLNVTVHKGGSPSTATVASSVHAITGSAQTVPFADEGSGSYIGTFQIDERDTYTFNVSVDADGSVHLFSFQQDLAPGTR